MNDGSYVNMIIKNYNSEEVYSMEKLEKSKQKSADHEDEEVCCCGHHHHHDEHDDEHEEHCGCGPLDLDDCPLGYETATSVPFRTISSTSVTSAIGSSEI